MMKKEFTDQLNRSIEIPFPPQRIVSLVPSQTELLFALGLEEEVVGITKFCIHPVEQWKRKRRVGGTKTLNFDRIDVLQPDLIIGNKEENEKKSIEALAKCYPVWMSDVQTIQDAYDMIIGIGALVGKAHEAKRLVRDIQSGFQQLTQLYRPLRIAYFIWREPYMVAAQETFIHELLNLCGFVNVFNNTTRYPTTSLKELEQLQVDLILLSSEPYPFKTKHIDEIHQILPNVAIRLVDGEFFSWYGSRLLLAVPYFNKLIQSLKIST